MIIRLIVVIVRSRLRRQPEFRQLSTPLLRCCFTYIWTELQHHSHRSDPVVKFCSRSLKKLKFFGIVGVGKHQQLSVSPAWPWRLHRFLHHDRQWSTQLTFRLESRHVHQLPSGAVRYVEVIYHFWHQYKTYHHIMRMIWQFLLVWPSTIRRLPQNRSKGLSWILRRQNSGSITSPPTPTSDRILVILSYSCSVFWSWSGCRLVTILGFHNTFWFWYSSSSVPETIFTYGHWSMARGFFFVVSWTEG